MLPDHIPPLDHFGIPATRGARVALRHAHRALQEGDRALAYEWATRAMRESPDDLVPRLWQVWLAPAPDDAARAVREALQLAPGDTEVKQALADTIERLGTTAPARVVTPEPALPRPGDLRSDFGVLIARAQDIIVESVAGLRSAPLFSLALLTLLVFLFAAGSLAVAEILFPSTATAEAAAFAQARNETALLIQRADEAWTLGQHDAAIKLLLEAHRRSPHDPALALLVARHRAVRALEHLHTNQPDLALPHLAAAHELFPNDANVTREYEKLLAYLDARAAYQVGDWNRTEEILRPVLAEGEVYLDSRAMLTAAGTARREVERLTEARRARALVRARRTEAGRAARESLLPTTPSNEPGQEAAPPVLAGIGGLSGKHIVVSINAQRMYVYENGRLIWDWIASTGEPARPTIPGRYRIQSKIPNARSNVWSLWMPYWMGIYWAGSVENGIHGQVTFDNGGRLWEGALGTQITFGCVMISDEHAAILFDWAEIGTPVSIHWDWDPLWVPNANGDPL